VTVPIYTKRRLFATLFTLLLLLLLGLGVSEAALRIFFPQPLGVSYTGAGELPIHTPDYDFHYMTDEFDIHTHFNSMGLRDREYASKKPPHTYRILVLGDSITEALQVEDREVYTEILEASLNTPASATRYEVINAGVSGYGAGDELKMYELLGASLDPDLVVVQVSLINDLSEDLFCRWYRVEDGRIFPIEEASGGPESRFEEFLGRHSHVAQILRHGFYVYFGKKSKRLKGIAAHKEKYHAFLYAGRGSEADFSSDWKVTFAYLEELHERVTQSGARFLLLIRPLDPDVQGLRKSEYPRNLIRAFCEERGIEILDLTPAFAEKSGGDISRVRFKKDSHWIPQAHRWAAESLYERVQGSL